MSYTPRRNLSKAAKSQALTYITETIQEPPNQPDGIVDNFPQILLDTPNTQLEIAAEQFINAILPTKPTRRPASVQRPRVQIKNRNYGKQFTG